MRSGFLHPVPQPDAVPVSASRAQCKIVLTEAGLWGQVEQAVAGFNSERVNIWFTDAGRWERNHTYVTALGYEIGLTDEQMDDYFRAAVKVL